MCMLKSYIFAAYPLLWVKTHEEIRVRNDYASQLLGIRIENEAEKVEIYSVWSWDIADGLCQLKLKQGSIIISERVKDSNADPLIPILWLEKAPENTVLLLKDYHNYLGKDAKDHDICIRKIRNLLELFKARNQALIIVSPILDIPVELNKEVTVLDYRLPGREELKQVMKAVHSASINGNKSFTYPKDDNPIIDACRGMTSSEAENALSRSVVDHKCFDAKLIQSEKANIVKKSGRLEIVDTTLGVADIGGLENLKAWLMARRECFSEAARQFGIIPPKGMLLVGVPGCGKSLTAKATASILGRPLLRLDMGNVFGSYVGESEGNMKAVLEMCESIAPIVLWIDELEKNMAGNKGGMEGHETTRRVFQMLLTWMQEKTADVFLVATANSIQSLPPELIRPGRIDVTFWVDLPDHVQRKEIFQIHLAKRGRDPKVFTDMDAIIAGTEGYSGAEIEVIVGEALVRAYSRGSSEVEVSDILESALDITPISRLMSADIEASRKWKQGRGIKDASITHVLEQVDQSNKRKIR